MQNEIAMQLKFLTFQELNSTLRAHRPLASTQLVNDGTPVLARVDRQLELTSQPLFIIAVITTLSQYIKGRSIPFLFRLLSSKNRKILGASNKNRTHSTKMNNF